MDKYKKPGVYKLVLLSAFIACLFYANTYMTDSISTTQRLKMIGQINTANSSQGVQAAKALPLVSYNAKRAKSVTSLSVKEDIFVQVEDEEVKVEVPVIKTDYRKLLQEQISVQSVSAKGAIINGQFVQTGGVIPGVEVKFATGGVASGILDRVFLEKGDIRVTAGEESVVL